MFSYKDALIEKFASRQAIIGIVGLGYVGLPLMLRYNSIGFRVVGIDIDNSKVDTLNQGKSYIEHISSQSVSKAVETGFEATTDFSRASECDALILCVPTPLNKYREPDMSFVINTVNALKPHFRHGQDRRYHHLRVGVNSRLDTLQAAILLPKLEIFPEELSLRQQVAKRYTEQLAAAGIAVPHVESHNTSAWAQYTVRVDRRETVQSRLKEQGIPTAVHYPIPVNRQPAVEDTAASLPVGDRMAEQVMSLPMHPYLSEGDQMKVIKGLVETEQR